MILANGQHSIRTLMQYKVQYFDDTAKTKQISTDVRAAVLRLIETEVLRPKLRKRQTFWKFLRSTTVISRTQQSQFKAVINFLESFNFTILLFCYL